VEAGERSQGGSARAHPSWTDDTFAPLRPHPRRSAYLKVAEACDLPLRPSCQSSRSCAATHGSRRSSRSVRKPTSWRPPKASKELILISQNHQPNYGLETSTASPAWPDLLRALGEVENPLDRVALRLSHRPEPACSTPYREVPNVCPTLDLPLQHSIPRCSRR